MRGMQIRGMSTKGMSTKGMQVKGIQIKGMRVNRTHLLLIGKIVVVTSLIAWLFYDSAWGLCWGVVVAWIFLREHSKQQKKKELFQLEKEFQTGLVFAAGALEAGYSVENAWVESEKDLIALYGDSGSYVKLLSQINQRVRMNQALDSLIWELGQNSPSTYIQDFSEVFYFARKSGGNMALIMRKTANRIHQHFQVQEEIQLVLSGKQLELLILYGMPFGILAYLRVGSAGFLDPVYHNGLGILLMTGCVIAYGFAWHLAKRIVDSCQL